MQSMHGVLFITLNDQSARTTGRVAASLYREDSVVVATTSEAGVGKLVAPFNAQREELDRRVGDTEPVGTDYSGERLAVTRVGLEVFYVDLETIFLVISGLKR